MARMSDAEYYKNSNVTIIEETNYTKGVGPLTFGGACPSKSGNMKI